MISLFLIQLITAFNCSQVVEFARSLNMTVDYSVDCCMFEGVDCDRKSILWKSKQLNGTLDMLQAPVGLKKLDISQNDLTGTIDNSPTT